MICFAYQDNDEILHELVLVSFANDYYKVKHPYPKEVLNRDEKDAMKSLEETTPRIGNLLK